MKTKTGMIVAVAMGLGTFEAGAQTNYPSQSIELWVGFSPGGPFDVLARTIAPFFERHLGGAEVIVVNKPGAGGALMQSQLANATPDGHTFALISHAGLVSVLFGGDVQYEVDDFEFIGSVFFEPYALFVGMNSPYSTVEDIVEAARNDPGGVTIGSTGLGTPPYLALKDLERVAGIELNIIPTIGAAEMQNNVMGGHIDAGLTGYSFTSLMHAQDQGRIVGVMSRERLEQAQDFPTFTEAGYDLEWGTLRGFAAPGGTPREVMDKLTEALRLTTEDPEYMAMAAQTNQILAFRPGDVFRQDVTTIYQTLQELWEAEPWIQN